MQTLSPLQTYFPIGIVLVLAIGMGAAMLFLANVLGPRRPSTVKSTPFECGSLPVGSARERFGVKFYVVALLFIVFDIEAIFLYPWAVLLLKDPGCSGPGCWQGLGWAGYVEMGIFVLTLVAGLVYVWKKGVLDWND